ncbi:hypothetical protein [Streptomyces sp. NPDC126514]|uniref:hypothetical protein n=1 Tax=Streptomyces sp. NPDC126514 TaxID=3155210 RepID=UPI00332F0B59
MSGSLRMPPGAPDTLPVIPRQRTPRWAGPDPVDELAERLDGFVAAAVHPDEIAALLESDGLSDDQIRERYGVKNSFALAEELYERVARRYPEPENSAPDPWRTSLLSCLLRGVVFALPGFGYVLGAPLLAGPPDDHGLPAGTVPLLAAALFGWAWNQGLAHRAYTWLGLGDRAAARRSLLLGGPAGSLLGALVALLAAGTAAPAAVAFAAGQSCYLGAATALLVLGRERALLAALLPMTAGAVLALVRPVPDAARLTLLLGSAAAVAVLAVRAAAPRGSGTPAAGPAPGTVALTASLPYALFGLSTGVLVVYAALGDVLAGDGLSAVAAPAAVALTLSMGPAEWLLHRFRSRGLAGLRACSTPKAFRRTTARALVACLGAYLAALLALDLVTAALWPHAPAVSGLRLAGLLLLGVVMWTGLLLQSFGAVAGAALICVLAALAHTLALVTHTGGPHTVGAAVYGAAALAQSALVCVLLGRATAHR